MLSTLSVSGYRSLREVVLPLGRLTVVTGPNGSGKSSLYRSLRLLAECARGGAVAAMAREGGLPSTLWAGPERVGRAVREGEHPLEGTARKTPVGLRLGFASDDGFGYAVDLGLPPQAQPTDGRRSAFSLDPEFKVEAIWSGPTLRPATTLAERRGPLVRIRDDDGSWRELTRSLRAFDSMLDEVSDPQRAPELLWLRERLRSWRFYDRVRTDTDAPARSSSVGTRTPVLGHDGSDLAAAVQTIREVGAEDQLDAAVTEAFPGSRVEVTVAGDGRFELVLRQAGILRPMRAAELSEGTLRYLVWVAALLSPRPPELLVINEPEMSLHPDLLPALARLLLTAAGSSQILTVTHSVDLAERLAAGDEGGPLGAGIDVRRVELSKDEFGQTRVGGQEGLLDHPTWHWPAR